MKKLILTCSRALPIFFALIVMLSGCRDDSLSEKEAEKNKEPTPDELTASAKNGDAASIAKILSRIEAGESFPIDRETAFTMLKQASDNQDPVAQLHFGEMLINGTSSSPKNVEGGIELLKKAADSENSDALLCLGQIHLHGLNGRFRNTKFGLEYLKKAIVKGNKDAQREIGAWNAFYSQEDNSQEAAIGFLEPIAKGGDVLAQRYMGYIRRKIEASGKNQNGLNSEVGSRDEGLKQTQSNNELKTSEDWFKLAAENGDAPSMYALGELYIDNDYKDASVNAKIETAINWYLKAAENGNQNACKELAAIYSGNKFKVNRTGSAFFKVPEAERSRFINLEKAIKFYEKSIELGDLYSYDDLANIYLNRDHSVFLIRKNPQTNFITLPKQ